MNLLKLALLVCNAPVTSGPVLGGLGPPNLDIVVTNMQYVAYNI